LYVTCSVDGQVAVTETVQNNNTSNKDKEGTPMKQSQKSVHKSLYRPG